MTGTSLTHYHASRTCAYRWSDLEHPEWADRPPIDDPTYVRVHEDDGFGRPLCGTVAPPVKPGNTPVVLRQYGEGEVNCLRCASINGIWERPGQPATCPVHPWLQRAANGTCPDCD